MKNLKKLSVVFMLTALFSTSFISCIDNSVSDSVDSIYEAQADLLAAQAAVLNAEAELLLAQATVQEANAQLILANAAQVDALTDGIEDDNAFKALKREQELRVIIATADTAVRVAEIALETAELNFQKEMDRIIAEIEAAGVQRATQYAFAYAATMGQANNINGQIVTKKNDLATQKLMLNGDVTWEFALEQLNSELANLEADKAAKEYEIEMMEAYLADPNTAEAISTEMEAEYWALADANAALDVEIAIIRNEITVKYQEWFDGDDLIWEVEQLEIIISDLEAEIKLLVDENVAKQKDIDDAQALLDDYENIVAIAEAAVTAAEGGVTAAQEAIDTAEGELGEEVLPAPALGDDPIAPAETLYEVLWNAQLDALTKTDEYNTMAADFALLTITYNQAATALADGITVVEGSGLQAALDAAILAKDAADAALLVAEATYADAKSDYEAAPTGSVDADLPLGHVDNPGVVDDLDVIGLVNTTTYMEVATWAETFVGSTEYIPTSFTGVMYDQAGLDARIAFLMSDVNGTATAEGGVYNINSNSSYVVWEQDGSSLDAVGDPVAQPVAGTHLDDIEVAIATSTPLDPNIGKIWFLEVQADDTSITNLFAFNVATNELGSDTFDSRPYTDPLLTPADTFAGYDSTPDTNGEPDSPADMLTARAVAWNAAKDVVDATKAVADEAAWLQDLQDAYDYQKGLFDGGEAAVEAAEEAKDLADEAVVDAQADVDAAIANIGVEILPAPVAGDTAIDNDPNTLYEDLWNAELVLADAEDFLANIPTEAALQTIIDDCQAIIDANLLMISELNILLAKAEEELAERQAEYDALMLTPLNAQQWVDILELWQEIWALEDQQYANTAMQTALVNIGAAMWGDIADARTNDDVQDDIDTLYEDLAAIELDIEKKEVEIAKGDVSVEDLENKITACEAEIAALESRLENVLALAARYKELMEAELAS